ncbi:MAG: hypothetical protein LBO63_01035 [Oscillospiraceae bacterium]|nr:hypothetical protein [Oscillospiraceae bacterium]
MSACTAQKSPVAETDKLVICYDYELRGYVEILMNPLTGEPFHILYPNVEVELIALPDPTTDEALYESVRQKMRIELMSGSGADLFILNSPSRDFEGVFPDVEKFMRSGLFCDLRELYTDPYSGTVYVDESLDPAAMLVAGQIDGKQLTLPLNYNFTTIMTNELSQERLGVSNTSDTAEVLAGLRRLFAPSGAGRMALTEAYPQRSIETPPNDVFLNPYDYTVRPIVDYVSETATIDTPLTRDVLETGKFLYEHMRQLRQNGWLRRDQVFSEAVSGGYGDYVFSEDYAVLGRIDDLYHTENRFVSTFYDYSPRIAAIPGEEGAINAVVTYYGAIRAGSANKLNAMRFLALIYNKTRTQYRDDGTRRIPPSGAAAITDLNSVRNWNTNLGRMASATEATAQQENALWARVSSSRYPVPKEVTDIIMLYYEGEIDLDDAIRRMSEYWKISLSE